MIITCEHCTTRFQLDDARIPAQGVKVRCSRCKHAFFVKRPDLEAESDRQAVAELAREARRSPDPAERSAPASDGAAAPAEERTQALEEPVERTQAEERTELLGSVGRFRDDEDEESDWQFNEDPGEPAPEPEPARARPAAEALPGPPEDPMGELFAEEAGDEDASLDDLGSPDQWDLLGEGEDEGAAPTVDPSPSGRVSGPAADPTSAPRREAAPAASAPAPGLHAAETPELEPSGSRSTLGRALGAAAWASVALLLVWTAAASLRSRPSAPPGPRSVVVGGLQAEAVQGRIVENAGAGFLLVVRATLRNPGDRPRLPEGPLVVRLLDAAGEPLAAAPVAPRPSESELRLDRYPELATRQRARGRALAELPFAPGETLAVSAVFPEVPSRARAFRFELAAGEPAAGEPAAGEPAAGEIGAGEPGAGEPVAAGPGAGPSDRRGGGVSSATSPGTTPGTTSATPPGTRTSPPPPPSRE